MLYLILLIIVFILAILLAIKWSKPFPSVKNTPGTLEDEIEMKTKELAILRKKKELSAKLDEVNEQLKQEQTTEKDS